MTKELKYKLGNLIAVCLVVCAGAALLFLYWNSRPLARMRLVHQIELVTFPVAHRTRVDPSSKPDQGKNAQEVPVLLYHGIFDGPDDGFNISKETFINQMKSLKRNGYTTISMAQYLDFISGKIELPYKSVLITFDDGRKDSYYRADTVLNAMKFKAVMFLTSGYSLVDGSNYYVDRDEMMAMHKSGRWDIEAHADYAGTNQIAIDAKGTTANFFGKLKWVDKENRQETLDEYRERVSMEMDTVKTELTGYLGDNTIKTLAFPFGDYGQSNDTNKLTTILLEEAHRYYQQVFIQFRKGDPYSSNYKQKDGFMSRRIEVDPRLSGDELSDLLISATAKPLPYTATLKRNEGWKTDWGTIDYNNDQSLSIGSGKGTSAAVYLDGTRQLTRYGVSAEVTVDDPATVVKIIAPYIDGRNYIGCNFNSNAVRVEQLTNGQRKTVGQKSYNYESTGGKRTKLSIKMEEDGHISCYSDDQLVVSVQYDGSSFGGPAISVWNPQPGTARATLKSFSLMASE